MTAVYDLLYEIARRPEPFSRYTAKELWTRPHLARQMLQYHLSQETDLASRPIDTVNRVVGWIDGQVPLNGLRLCDLGCGPGLYAQRFAALGAEVTGVDFSRHSLDYARTHGEQPVRYIEADYLADERLALDHYLIVEPDQTWQIFNWLQYFTPQSIETELKGAGFEVEQLSGDLTGTPLAPDGDSIAVIAVKA